MTLPKHKPTVIAADPADYQTDPKWGQRLRRDAGPVDQNTQLEQLRRDLTSDMVDRVYGPQKPKTHWVVTTFFLMIFAASVVGIIIAVGSI